MKKNLQYQDSVPVTTKTTQYQDSGTSEEKNPPSIKILTLDEILTAAIGMGDQTLQCRVCINCQVY